MPLLESNALRNLLLEVEATEEDDKTSLCLTHFDVFDEKDHLVDLSSGIIEKGNDLFFTGTAKPAGVRRVRSVNLDKAKDKAGISGRSGNLSGKRLGDVREVETVRARLAVGPDESSDEEDEEVEAKKIQDKDGEQLVVETAYLADGTDSSDEDTMTIFVKTMVGVTVTLAVEPWDTVEKVKAQIRQEGFNPDEQRLIFAGRQLEDGKTLGQCGVHDQATIVEEDLLMDFFDLSKEWPPARP